MLTDSAACVPPPTYLSDLSEEVPGTFCGGVPTYHKRRLVGNRPPIWEGARTHEVAGSAGWDTQAPNTNCRLPPARVRSVGRPDGKEGEQKVLSVWGRAGGRAVRCATAAAAPQGGTAAHLLRRAVKCAAAHAARHSLST